MKKESPFVALIPTETQIQTQLIEEKLDSPTCHKPV